MDNVIICNCKKVTKLEIINAIKEGANTLEKVKKATNANKYGCYNCKLKIEKLIEINK